MSIKVNKRAEEKLFSFWTIFLLVVIFVVFVFVFGRFLGDRLDIRATEADTLSLVLTNCLIEEDIIRGDFFDEDFDIFLTCNLDKYAVENYEYYFFVEVNGKKIEAGDSEVYSDCLVSDYGTKGKYFSKCLAIEMPIYYFDGPDKKETNITFFSSSNNLGKRIIGGVNAK